MDDSSLGDLTPDERLAGYQEGVAVAVELLRTFAAEYGEALVASGGSTATTPPVGQPSAALRAYVDRRHQPGEPYTTRTDYGTGIEHGLACICGADWGEDERNDGCAERLELLAISNQWDRGHEERRER